MRGSSDVPLLSMHELRAVTCFDRNDATEVAVRRFLKRPLVRVGWRPGKERGALCDRGDARCKGHV